MKVLHLESGILFDATIELVENEDWVFIEKSEQFIFDWRREKTRIVKKICLMSDHVPLGLVSYDDISSELRIHIHLIENSRLNKGKNKKYDFLTGALIAHLCQIAFEKNYGGFVSLEPKTELAAHYKIQYGFDVMGRYMFTELANSERLIQKYLIDE